MIVRALLLVIACALLLRPVPTVAEDAAIKIATIPIDGGAEVLYAQERGYFKKAGLNVEIQQISNGAAIAAAVASGAVDIGFSNIVSLATAYQKNIPIALIAPAGLYSSKAPVIVCLVPKSSAILSAKDFNGKTIAANGLKGIVQYAPAAWVDKNGGDAKTLKFVEMTFPEMPAALSAGRVDVAVVSEPYVTDAKKAGRVVSNCFDGVANDFLISAYFTTTAWAKAHPVEAQKFEDVIRQAAVWANHDQAQSADILIRASKMDPQTVQTMVRSVYAERFDPAQVQPVLDVTAKYGGLSSSFPAGALYYRSSH
jgi:NitT/TauT family transport system substrate-binding protein